MDRHSKPSAVQSASLSQSTGANVHSRTGSLGSGSSHTTSPSVPGAGPVHATPSPPSDRSTQVSPSGQSASV
jgi:hypothetical protein